MMRAEFEEILGTKVDPTDYARIEFVYNYHPSIPEVGGKEVIANLYKIGGNTLMKDMYGTAQRGKELEEAIHRTQQALDRLKAEYKTFKEGTA